ncbi:hypothetical protein Lepto7376_3012 [[Leptolyngbya] sp. PCC 7376]|uniref:hypothetical protein n=1 Tax=[Leptolyngbya] sp. PCC 7376 TaxID=111781 RepID=UPI00029EE77A|nr:hypothetical protein [[Leptolyngbya] sp. PCC 7376]AFY39253.1 hypothetical protein Lepto7376_3012 [[Leptolyngbya] sp. PCC 7376]
MAVKQSQYEALLAQYSERSAAITLLKQHRPYLSLIPSMRRPEKSLVTIPLPVARLKTEDSQSHLQLHTSKKITKTQILPCDLAILMCDPEWKVKLGVEIMVFIHRPDEDFSELLLRWRHTQVYLDQDYEWLMPNDESHMFSEMAEQVCPLFVIFPETPERISRGLQGANLPYIVAAHVLPESDLYVTAVSSDS